MLRGDGWDEGVGGGGWVVVGDGERGLDGEGKEFECVWEVN